MNERTTHAILAVIVLVFVLLGVLYAVETPAWQVPDEPAHYNYVRHVAEQGRLPVLRVGDYPAEYLEEIKARRFPAAMSVDPIRYEAHQPPLYYVVAALAYRALTPLGVPMPLGLRLLSVAIGAGALVVGYHGVRHAVPAEPLVALGAVAFAATLPMHVAMCAAVNNDVLVEFVLAAIALAVIRPMAAPWSLRRTVGLGVLVGLALLTKLQAAIGIGLVFVALYRDATGGRWRAVGAVLPHLGRLLLLLGVALLVASPWLVRNALVYGPGDPLALARHDQVVRGQLTTAEYLAQHGARALLSAFARTTFRSFWGQFGWMGVPMDERVYVALGVLSALVGVGLPMRLLRRRAPGDPSDGPVPGSAALLATWVGLSVLGYLWWNLTYVQHQGRYLFPAIIPLGVAFTLGWMGLTRARARTTLSVVGGTMAIAGAWGAAARDLPGLVLALLAAAGVGLSAARWVEARVPGASLAACYGAVGLLAVVALYRFVVPALGA